jgi:hypothetical protein
MNWNREQFLRAVERGLALLTELKKDYPELGLKPVFSRFGPRSGQCDLTTDLRKIVLEFPEMLAGEFIHREGSQGTQNSQSEVTKSFSTADRVKQFRKLLMEIRQAEKGGEKEAASDLRKEAAAQEKALLDPELELYCGDVLIEYRPGNLKYEPLRRLQQDARLPSGLNTAGNIRVIAGSLEFLGNEGEAE